MTLEGPLQLKLSFNSMKFAHGTDHLFLQAGWFWLGRGESGSGNCAPHQQLQGWENVPHPAEGRGHVT